MTLFGRYTTHADLPDSEYHLIELPGHSAFELSTLLRGIPQEGAPVSIEIGAGCLQFQLSSVPGLRACLTQPKSILITADPRSIATLADELQAMSDTPVEPDYLPHVHLDAYLTEPLEGLSDIVIQRYDD